METKFDPKGKRLLAISAHPDDLDFAAGGTFIKWLSQGAKAAIVVVTNGDKGSDNRTLTSEKLVEIRKSEQEKASKLLGLEETWYLGYPDAQLEVGQTLKEKLVKIIRSYRPDAVFTFDPTMVYSLKRGFINHPDHRAVGQASLDAVFPLARDFLSFPKHLSQGLEPHNVTDLFLYNFDQYNFMVDITEQFEDKINVLACHKSQVDLSKVRERVEKWNWQLGKKLGVKYAEAFLHLSLS